MDKILAAIALVTILLFMWGMYKAERQDGSGILSALTISTIIGTLMGLLVSFVFCVIAYLIKVIFFGI